MTAAAWTLQQAVFAALAGIAGGRIYDAVPRGAVFPYVVIGDGDESDAGTSDAPASEHTLSIHIWSRGGGAREIKQLAAAVRGALDAARTLDGHTLVSLRFVSADYTRQSDGETWRGSLRLRALTEPN
jgi:hypothetical protein